MSQPAGDSSDDGSHHAADNSGPTPNPNDNNNQALGAVRQQSREGEESDINRMGRRRMAGAGNQIMERNTESYEERMHRKQQQLLDLEQKADSFSVMRVVRARASGSHRDLSDSERKIKEMTTHPQGNPGEVEESDINRKGRRMAGAGNQIMERNTESYEEKLQRKQQQQQQQQLNPEQKADSFNVMTVVQARASGSERDFSDSARKIQEMSIIQGNGVRPPTAPAGNNGTTSAMSSWLGQFNTTSVEDLPTQPSAPRPESQPGAYTAAPGTTMDRVEEVRFSMFTRRPEAQTTHSSENHVLTTTPEDPGSTSAMRPPPTLLPDGNDNSNNSYKDELMEAVPVESEQFSSSMMEAQPVDQENLDQKEVKYTMCKLFGCGFLVTACVLLIVTLAIGLTNSNDDKSNNDFVVPTGSPTISPAPSGSPTRPLPPMENLESLYAELPDRTRESLYHIDSPQYQAWEWLLHHPDVSTYPEWRKMQIFAMVTFYYSFEGPLWSEPTRSRWLNTSSSECSWVMSEEDVQYHLYFSYMVLGPVYSYADIVACNQDGRIQTFGIDKVRLSSTAKPFMPPEIGLLTSLRMMAVSFTPIDAKLSDLLIPELTQLPELVYMNFHSSGLKGPIPKQIGSMTNVRHFMIGENQLTGTLPSQIAKMTSLEFFVLSHVLEGERGNIPSELGLLTSLTGLLMYSCKTFTGQIPSQLGGLTGVGEFSLDGSSLTGSIPTELGLLSGIRKELSLDGIAELGGPIPSELGLLTGASSLQLGSGRLTGSIPSELGLLTSIEELRLNNNALTGVIPTELGMLTDARALILGNELKDERSYNNFWGYYPQELWKLSKLEWLLLSNLPSLQGSIPTSVAMPNMTVLRLEGNDLSGFVPEEFCFLQDMPAPSKYDLASVGQALDFDCSGWLCGCDCQCVVLVLANETNSVVGNKLLP